MNLINLCKNENLDLNTINNIIREYGVSAIVEIARNSNNQELLEYLYNNKEYNLKKEVLSNPSIPNEKILKFYEKIQNGKKSLDSDIALGLTGNPNLPYEIYEDIKSKTSQGNKEWSLYTSNYIKNNRKLTNSQIDVLYCDILASDNLEWNPDICFRYANGTC